MANMKIKMYTDGGARGNPGPAAVGVLIRNEDGDMLLEHGETIGRATNNVAEYRALLKGLQCAKEVGATIIECFLDSELVVKQLSGEFKVKNANMRKLYNEVRYQEKKFREVTYTHVRREQKDMRIADQLVNFALDDEERLL